MDALQPPPPEFPARVGAKVTDVDVGNGIDVGVDTGVAVDNGVADNGTGVREGDGAP